MPPEFVAHEYCQLTLDFGLWRIGQWGMRSEQVANLVSACLDLGIDTFDVADIYGNYQCESMFGAALKNDPSLNRE